MKALMSYRFNAIIFIFLSIALFSSNANAQTVEPADPSLLELLGVPVEEDEDEYYYEDEGEGYDDFGPFFDLVADTVPDSVPEYDEARRMLKFLDNFIPIAPDEIPPTSILREFIGGSSFQY